MSIQFGFTGPLSFVMAIVIATPFALILGGGYGWLLNKIKGGGDDDRHLCGLLIGFLHVYDVAFAALQQSDHGLGLSGKGLRTTHLPGGLYDKVLTTSCIFRLKSLHSGGQPSVLLRCWPS